MKQGSFAPRPRHDRREARVYERRELTHNRTATHASQPSPEKVSASRIGASARDGFTGVVLVKVNAAIKRWSSASIAGRRGCDEFTCSTYIAVVIEERGTHCVIPVTKTSIICSASGDRRQSDDNDDRNTSFLALHPRLSRLECGMRSKICFANHKNHTRPNFDITALLLSGPHQLSFLFFSTNCVQEC
ncbi:hypothetical protein L917_11784 [Phytophthora nicotianae]|uniref:Uncharacterized protein n=1 Tax=Phytophthora nicotianae TaxID=4792 RepID=W2KY20_PHYNI|nr:hypothetical protein L917_11784 [Phytophthora nicotianae]